MADATYYERNKDKILERAKETRREYYERNKERIKARNLERYHAAKAPDAQPKKPGRKQGTIFPEGYKRRQLTESAVFTRADFNGALKSPPADDVIFEEVIDKPRD